MGYWVNTTYINHSSAESVVAALAKVFAVFPDADQWALVHTAPLELLAEAGATSGERPIDGVCKELQCSAFMVNVYDSTGTILAECIPAASSSSADTTDKQASQILIVSISSQPLRSRFVCGCRSINHQG
jgi:hypothetical protein